MQKQEVFHEFVDKRTVFIKRVEELIEDGYFIDSAFFEWRDGYCTIIAHKIN